MLFSSSLIPTFSLDHLASILILILLLLASALVSGAEAAFFALSPDTLQELRQSPRQRDRRIASLLQTPRKLLATLHILNTGINLAVISLAAYLAWGIWGHLSFGNLVAFTLVVTCAIVFFGEVLPKVFGVKHQFGLARYSAPLLGACQVVLRPLSWVLLSLSKLIEQRSAAGNFYNYTSAEGLQQSLDMVINEESPAEEQLLKGIVNFGSVSVTQVMRSRLDIIAYEDTLLLPELMANIRQWGYSRLPIYHENIDKIEGILYIKDLLPYLDAPSSFAWQTLIRPPFFVPESKKISDLLRDFQEMHVHMAIVVDEYGGTSGLLTLDDIIEEIVGEINDEFDEVEDLVYSQLDENTFIFEGKTLLHDFCRVMDMPPELFNPVRGDSGSVAGLMLELFSRIPRVGEEIMFDRLKFVIESADNRRIKRVKVHVVHLEENVRKDG